MNDDDKVIKDFGDEWNEYDYQSCNNKKLLENFEEYFSIFPWNNVAKNSADFDTGCCTQCRGE
ncbi:hypothetical protein N9W44_01770 [Alphaproteobacteria bacterium]|nr:hypothetical protein [Alphaproteobacteria bacterium]